jgi:hypothetical protein
MLNTMLKNWTLFNFHARLLQNWLNFMRNYIEIIKKIEKSGLKIKKYGKKKKNCIGKLSRA